jgi:hypothetical protein
MYWKIAVGAATTVFEQNLESIVESMSMAVFAYMKTATRRRGEAPVVCVHA